MNDHALPFHLARILLLSALLAFGGNFGRADTITLTWEPPAADFDVTYKLYRAKISGAPFLPVATAKTTYARIFTPGPSNGQLYYVTAVTADGSESSPSNIIEIGKTLGISVEPDGLILQWNDDRYALEAAPTPSGPWTLHTTNSPAFTDTSKPMNFFRLTNR